MTSGTPKRDRGGPSPNPFSGTTHSHETINIKDLGPNNLPSSKLDDPTKHYLPSEAEQIHNLEPYMKRELALFGGYVQLASVDQQSLF